MIGIYINNQVIRFLKKDSTGRLNTFDHPAHDDAGNPISNIQNVFEQAKKELGFSQKNDFRLLVDFPICHFVVQSVPFPESQLAQVLENYLEEELPDDIDDYSFAYHVIASKGNSSAIVGFWIKHDALKSWTELADELSLNSLDIQPAEAAFLPEKDAEPQLVIQKDLVGDLRYSCSCIKGDLPSITLGRLSLENLSPEKLAQQLKFQGPDWSTVSTLVFSDNLEEYQSLGEQLGIPKKERLESSVDPISTYAVAEGTPTVKSRYNYRKGEYAQKGVSERIMIPVTVVALAAIAIFSALAWQKYQLTQLETQYIAKIDPAKKSVWSELYPNKKINKSSTSTKNLTGIANRIGKGSVDNSSTDNKGQRTSCIQTLGRFFQYIQDDPEIKISKINITKKGITVSGESKDSNRIANLVKGFDAPNQTHFIKPSLTITSKLDKDKETTISVFSITTRIVTNTSKKKKGKKS